MPDLSHYGGRWVGLAEDKSVVAVAESSAEVRRMASSVRPKGHVSPVWISPHPPHIALPAWPLELLRDLLPASKRRVGEGCLEDHDIGAMSIHLEAAGEVSDGEEVFLAIPDVREQLAAAGIPGAYEGALRYVGNPALVSRTHFARFLVEQGICRDVGDVFSRYLVEGRPGFVPQRWAAMGEAVEWIVQAGARRCSPIRDATGWGRRSATP